ncbi:MAG: zinc ribbon domain-containing protein [Acidobacteriota bacterium]
MYCSTCGKSLNDNLNYCNSCGSRIEKNALLVGNSSQRLFILAAGFIGLVGIVGFIPLLQELLRSRLDQPAILIILFAYLLTIFLMFAVLIGHTWKKSGDIRIKAKGERDGYAPPPELRQVTTAQLDEARERPASVTEHTTRTLDHVPLSDR